MDTSGHLEALVERVMERARQEAASMVERAGKAAEREGRQAAEQRESRTRAVETTLRENAARRTASAQAEAAQEERRALMTAQEAAVEHVFAEALHMLESIDVPAERRPLLEQLVKQGLRALGVSPVRVRLNTAERDLVLAAEFPREIDGVAIVFDEETIETSGGPVVTDDSGRMLFENTFEARLDRMRERLRRLVAETLHLEDKTGGAR